MISRQLARILGGEVGVGSTFWLRVRLRKCRAPAPFSSEPPTLARRPQEEVIRRRFGGLHVLLAEDDIISREVALELLAIAGLQVDSDDNGGDALAQAGATDYALIILDMQMPGMGGLAAARAIRALLGHAIYPLIIAMTANAFDEDRQACLNAGMNDHVCKPVDPDALYATLLRWLESAGAAGTNSS